MPADGMNLDEMSVELAIRQLFDCAAAAGERHFLGPREQRRVSVRHLGTYKCVAAIVASAGRHFINHVKASAGMDVAQRRRPADGRWLYPMENGKRLDVRVSTIPTLYGEDMAIRLLDSSIGLMELENLGFHRKSLDIMMSLLARPSRLIVGAGRGGQDDDAL